MFRTARAVVSSIIGYCDNTPGAKVDRVQSSMTRVVELNYDYGTVTTLTAPVHSDDSALSLL